MEESKHGGLTAMEPIQSDLMGLLREPLPGQRWVSARQHKVWRPPTDVYETDTSVIIKVEIAGMEEHDFSISLDAKRLVISGVRHDPGAKLAYQQMEILYGHFETEVHLARAVDDEGIEAVYQGGFLRVSLPKAKPRQVPIVIAEHATDSG